MIVTRKTKPPAPHPSMQAADQVVSAMLSRDGEAEPGDDAMTLAWCEAGLVKQSTHYPALLGTPTWRERLVAARDGIAASSWRFALPAMPAAAAAAGLAFYVMTPHPGHYVAREQSQEITLADQSSVVLAPSSTVDFHMAGGKRLATLVGKAEFSVAHDREHPFFVTAGAAQVRVVGTHFTLTYRNACTQLSVLSGTVVMQSPSMAPRRLNAGEEAVNIDDGESVSQCLTADGQAAPLRWSYVDAPLSTVIEDIRRFYPRKITIASPELARQRVTMSFGIDEVQNILSIIPETLGAHLEQDGNRIAIVPDSAS
ncbi:hypothetical protein BH10PSE13_BH10PSE13_02640 [soil metagenome]